MDQQDSERCPKCGSADTTRILYGLPGGNIPPRAVLGGCCIHPGAYDWACRECGHRWGRLMDRSGSFEGIKKKSELRTDPPDQHSRADR